jgi:hypothetical protein
MKQIDYPIDFDGTVAAALAHPCCIDSRGNLYALRDDGATVLVMGPESGVNVQFQDAGSSQGVAWAITQERVFIRFNEGAQIIQAALPRTRDSIGLPTYRRSALAVTSASRAYLVHNTEEALYCFDIAPDGIRLCAKVEGYKAFGAWKDGDDLHVFGMRTRIHKIVKPWFSTAEGFSLKYGIGTLMRIDLSSGRVRVDAASDAKKALVSAWRADAGDGEDRYVRPLLEVWLDSVETAQGRVLIGGIMDERSPEFDDTSEEPHPADFVGIALYRRQGGRGIEFVRLLRGARYVGRIGRSDGDLLYFVKQDDPRDVFTGRHFSLRVTSDMQLPLMPIAFDWADENLWTVQFDPCHDARVGAVAAATTKVRNAPLPYRRHLAMSDDGVAWRFVHAFPEQRA